jgi:hypothetical protein
MKIYIKQLSFFSFFLGISLLLFLSDNFSKQEEFSLTIATSFLSYFTLFYILINFEPNLVKKNIEYFIDVVTILLTVMFFVYNLKISDNNLEVIYTIVFITLYYILVKKVFGFISRKFENQNYRVFVFFMISTFISIGNILS